jgi:hypothetical protein
VIQTVEALRAALPPGPARSPDSVLAGWTASVRGWLPRGGMLAPDAWAARHRGVQRLLVLQVLVILAFALREHHTSSAGMLLAAVPVAGATAASLPALGRH